ncbi:MAG: hypothetical protein ACRDS0_39680 [Pseudonocardiaceae bacterium]
MSAAGTVSTPARGDTAPGPSTRLATNLAVPRSERGDASIPQHILSHAEEHCTASTPADHAVSVRGRRRARPCVEIDPGPQGVPASRAQVSPSALCADTGQFPVLHGRIRALRCVGLRTLAPPSRPRRWRGTQPSAGEPAPDNPADKG